jgi:hypothetical protein
VGQSRREKVFTLNTYKFHSLGDYVAMIKAFGMTNSFTTEIVRKIHGILGAKAEVD